MRSYKRRAVVFVNDNFTGEEFGSREQMPAEYPALCITEDQMGVNKRQSIPNRNISLDIQYFHPAGKFERVVYMCRLIIKGDNGMRSCPDTGDAPARDRFFPHQRGETLVQICAKRQLTDDAPLNFMRVCGDRVVSQT
jgi:hypothetical protein